MKRCKARLEDITVEFCRYAILMAARKKKYRWDVRRALNKLDAYTIKLYNLIHNENLYLRDGKYKPINEGTRRKRRDTCCPHFFPEQCIHWTVWLLLSPWFEKRMYTYSCSCVKGRGVDYGRRAVVRYCRNLRESKYCLQLDIRKFYENIDKELLIELLFHEIKDKRIVAICA